VPFQTKRALGIDFFDGTADQAVEWVARNGGLVVAPAGPSMIALQHDFAYRQAIAQADLAIADSGWMVLFWRILRGEKLTRISGLKFFKRLLELPETHEPENFFWVLPSATAKEKTLAWSLVEDFSLTGNDLYVAPHYGDSVEDSALLQTIRRRKPRHIVIAIGGGMQDKIGSYLKQNCGYRPGIYCIGAAPGFVTGDQVRIPMWADRFYLGWIFRVFAQPRVFIPRFWSARELPRLILKYGKEMPPLIPA
jgi:N-acetylglucosaminyldiphosphoundecaprenol N-acetyl-beta-D-mannosaminyltransferase